MRFLSGGLISLFVAPLAISPLVIIPLAEAAECPTAFVKGQTLTLKRSEPYFQSTFTRDESGQLIEDRAVEVGENVLHEVTHRYTHPLAIQSREQYGNTFMVSYTEVLKALEQLPEIGAWETRSTVWQNGIPRMDTQTSFTFEGLEETKVGDCAYQSWQVLVETELPNGRTIAFRQFYAPKLSLILGSIQLDSEGGEKERVFYDEITLKEDP